MLKGLLTIESPMTDEMKAMKEGLGKAMRDSVEKRVAMQKASHAVEELFGWRKWSQEIPAIRFRSDWDVQLTPPFTGSLVRFRVSRGGIGDVSVYLDCHDMLGAFGSPYWEIHPSVDGDTERFPMADTDDLLDGIERSLLAFEQVAQTKAAEVATGKKDFEELAKR